MKYGIKVTWEDGVETWMQSFQEFNEAETKAVTYSSLQEATDAANNMGLKKFTVKPYVGE